jgi:Ser/Thr protein kinase RdoA (MazF antagonist)
MEINLAQIALTHYDLPNANLTFLGKSQNTTFRVDTMTGDRFLLRLHTGIESSSAASALEREPNHIQSELLWLNAIVHDTDLTIPQPVQNRFGEWVTRV